MDQVIADIRSGWRHLPHGMRWLFALQVALPLSSLIYLHVALGEPTLNLDALAEWFRFHAPSLGLELGEPILLSFVFGRWTRRRKQRGDAASERTKEPHCACCVTQ